MTRSGAIRGLLEVLRDPSPSLLRHLARSQAVILDDLLQPSPLRTAVLVALCRAWSRAGVNVTISLASGRDLGGREAGFFFEYDEDAGYGLKPFAATRSLRRTLFDAFVASGEAEIAVAGASGVSVVEPWSIASPAGDPDLADCVYAGVPLSEPVERWLAGRVQLVRCAEPDDEIRWIARQVRRRLDQGATPSDCVVAWPGVEHDATAVRAVFADFGIPIAFGAGEPVAGTPVARALVEIGRLALDGWPADRLLALADLCAWDLPLDPGLLGRLCQAAGVRGGPPKSWFGPLLGLLKRSGRADRISDLRKTVDRLDSECDRLASFTRPNAPDDWRNLVLVVAEGIGLETLAMSSGRAMIAWGAVLAALDELVADLRAIQIDPWPAAELADHLERAIARARYRPERDDPDRVAVVGTLELRGLAPRHAWLGGLVRGRFPRPVTTSAVLEPRLARQLDATDALAEARYLLHAALRNALDPPDEHTLALSWPASQGGRTAAPSPVLADLLDLPTDAGPTFGELVVLEPAGPTPPLATSEVERAATTSAAWRAHLDQAVVARLARHEAADAARQAGSQAYNGSLQRPPKAPETLSVTALEQLVRCPARYWFDRILEVGGDDPWSPELEPRRRGTALHRILHRFVEERGGEPLAGADRARAAADLHRVANEELDRVEAEGGFEPALQAWARGRWLAGLVDDRPAGVLGAWLDLEIRAEDPMRPIALEQSFDDLQIGPLRLRGQLDRLDRHRSGALLVTDYKTGSAPAAARVTEGLALQPLVYAEAAQRNDPDAPVAAAYLTLKRADDVRRRSWTGDPEALEQLTTPRERRHAAELGPNERRSLLLEAANTASTALQGAFAVTTLGATRAGCSYCPHARICRVEHADQVLDPGEGP